MTTQPPPWVADMTPLERSGYIGSAYGQPGVEHDPEWGPVDVYNHRPGVLADYASRAAQLPGVRLRIGAIAFYAIDDLAGGLAYPVLCGDIIEIRTTDEITDGRCGAIATDAETFQCEGHAAERRAFQALTEAEKAHWEREQERLYG